VDDLSAAEAAQVLGISARRIRALLEGGHLPGRQVGGRWLLPSRAVERRREMPHEGGRPLSQASTWNILAVLSGAEDSLHDLPAPARSRARSRARDLREADQIASKWPSALANRAHSGRFYGHPSVLEDLLADPRVVRSGISAAMDYNAGLVAAGSAEGYVRSSDAESLRSDYALNPNVSPAQANVLLHVVRDEQATRWFFGCRVAPVAVVAADLAEREAHRDRDAGLKLAARL
jgi:excisionase family DNA binding protein